MYSKLIRNFTLLIFFFLSFDVKCSENLSKSITHIILIFNNMKLTNFYISLKTYELL